MRDDQAGGFGACPQDGPAPGQQPGMCPGAGPAQVQALAFDAFGGESPFQRRHVALDPAAKATGWAQQEHPTRHDGFPAHVSSQAFKAVSAHVSAQRLRGCTDASPARVALALSTTDHTGALGSLAAVTSGASGPVSHRPMGRLKPRFGRVARALRYGSSKRRPDHCLARRATPAVGAFERGGEDVAVDEGNAQLDRRCHGEGIGVRKQHGLQVDRDLGGGHGCERAW